MQQSRKKNTVRKLAATKLTLYEAITIEMQKISLCLLLFH